MTPLGWLGRKTSTQTNKQKHEQNSIIKYTTMGPMITKEMKYNLHYDEVKGDWAKYSLKVSVIVYPFC